MTSFRYTRADCDYYVKHFKRSWPRLHTRFYSLVSLVFIRKLPYFLSSKILLQMHGFFSGQFYISRVFVHNGTTTSLIVENTYRAAKAILPLVTTWRSYSELCSLRLPAEVNYFHVLTRTFCFVSHGNLVRTIWDLLWSHFNSF